MRCCVTAEALLVDFLGRVLGRIENLGDISAAIHVALPAPWQLSSGAAAACIRANLVCGLSANFLPISSWQVTHVSWPTKSQKEPLQPLYRRLPLWRGAGAMEGSVRRTTPSINIKKLAVPVSFPSRTNRRLRYRLSYA